MAFSRELPKRLLNTKQIFSHGCDHAEKSGEINRLFSIISLDGAIESFLYTVIVELGAEIKNPKNPTFFEIFRAADAAVEKVNKKHLPLKSEIEALHETRNNAQHKAVIPSISSIERFLVYSSDFLRESYMLCFKVPPQIPGRKSVDGVGS
jgi:hypothetical protein